MSNSETRFDSLEDPTAAVQAVRTACKQFATSLKLDMSVLTPDDPPPELPTGEYFKYDDQLPSFCRAVARGEGVTVVTIRRNGNVVAFGLAEVPEGDSVSIECIDVGMKSRRGNRVSSTVQIEQQTFEVGISHVLVACLLNTIDSPRIHTDATTASSRYIFKSLGFHSYSDSNPCLLEFVTAGSDHNASS